MNPLVFVLGAGFNVDAAAEAGNPVTPERRPARYPLVSDLGRECFGLEMMPPEKSIEELFQESIDTGDLQPLETLYNLIMDADNYITPLLHHDGGHADNVYLRFLTDFPSAPLTTFNYDSLPELLLLGLGSWRPQDGYGVPVQVPVAPIENTSLTPDNDIRKVLHLHGSLCVYPVISGIKPRYGSGPNMLRLKKVPDFLFDPDCLGPLFSPYERVPAGHGYTHVSERVIAPIPDKAKGLKAGFIKAVYDNAIAIVSRATEIVVIGYSFNPHDYASYGPLLKAAAGRRIWLVTPNAHLLVGRLVNDHPDIDWQPVPVPFQKWVCSGYPGVMK